MLCLETLVRVAPISRFSLFAAACGTLRHCSQADTNEAAVAHIAAQRPSDDNRAAISTASLVNVKATLRGFRSARNGP
jgi:hypothetical protein